MRDTARDINLRKGWSGFIADIKRDVKSSIFWNNPLAHLSYRYGWNMRPAQMVADNAPLAVDVELSNGCNFRCVMCQQSENWLQRKDEAFMSWETLREAVSQCKEIGVYSMKVNWRGESTLDPDCGKKGRFIKDSG